MSVPLQVRTTDSDPSYLVVVANRLPVESVTDDLGGVTWRRSPGGLVSALDPVMRDRDALWIGWGGRFDDDPEETLPLPESITACQLDEVFLPRQLAADYYQGFSNSAIWPLYHNAVVTPMYHREQFAAYCAVNEIFANRVAEMAPPNATVWVHDYQLQLVPRLLRHLRPDVRIGFFLHIPFPPIELFSQLPWRRQILEGLLGADLVGFQTEGAATNFLALVNRFLGLRVGGDRVEMEELASLRTTLVRAFPIGIDADAYAALAGREDVQQRAVEIRKELGNPRKLILGVDRLDYTKGIDVRIRAFAELIQERDDDDQMTVLLQVATPSRENLEEYRKIRDDVELQVGRVNGDLGGIGYRPVHYLHQPMGTEELVAMYVAADVMLVTPLCDGMNLVAKEYVATRLNNDGALVLSEFTGAAEQLDQAWLVNPYDVDGLKRALDDALHAQPQELNRRMAALRARVHEYDVNRWARLFMATLEGLV
ncbi:trehalose-phosphate synthase [mine drainage metagenome]|uniref:Trehalose-phosphate synthase n=1 Tax=mine drainage metagenome TaxID=410659 RepID=A0A1J5PU66_9ZZZZ